MNIVIVGGGTAGWLAAFMINKTQPNHEITLIESSQIGIIGAGEGSTGILTSIIQGTAWDYGLSEKEFLSKTNATIKLGIRHKDWKTLGHEYIAPIDAPYYDQTIHYGTNKPLMHSILNDKKFHLSSQNGNYIENSFSSFYKYKGGIANNREHAYHFDAHLVGKYFKEKCDKKVKTIDSKVQDIVLSENGDISSIVLEDGFILEGDFFIDASGFSRVFSKKLNVDWISFSKYLPVNTAMPFLIEHKEGEKIDPVTTAWAQKNGWMWMIPTQERIGCGYVFDNRYVSNEDAQKEIETTLGREISPIKFLNFDAGMSKSFWNKNCLSIGLSAAFLEPLEATSIHSTVLQLTSFIFNYLRDDKESTCNSGSSSIYNKNFSKVYDGFKDFISIHYASSRKDSEFWKDISKIDRRTDFAANILKTVESRLPNNGDFYQYPGFAGADLYNWILSGLGYINKDLAGKELDFYSQKEEAKIMYELYLSNFNVDIQNQIDNTELISMIKNGTL
jgi:hypothetical protein